MNATAMCACESETITFVEKRTQDNDSSVRKAHPKVSGHVKTCSSLRLTTHTAGLLNIKRRDQKRIFGYHC
jgi:hypothetical protein